jgi:hypothetical protein
MPLDASSLASLAILYPAARPTHCGRPCQPNPQHVIAAEKEATPSFQIADGRELETARNVGHPLSHSTVALTASDCSTKKHMPGAVAVKRLTIIREQFCPPYGFVTQIVPGSTPFLGDCSQEIIPRSTPFPEAHRPQVHVIQEQFLPGILFLAS